MAFSFWGDTDSQGVKMIFDLIPLTVFWAFVAATLVAVWVHSFYGRHQEITLTFVVIVGVAVWLCQAPMGEPFPGSVKIVAMLSTALQLTFAGAAFFVYKKPTSCTHTPKTSKTPLKPSSLNSMA